MNWSALGTIGAIGALPALTMKSANIDTVACGMPSANFIPLCRSGNFNGIIDALAQDNLATFWPSRT